MRFALLIPIEPVDRYLSVAKDAHKSDGGKRLNVSFFDVPFGGYGSPHGVCAGHAHHPANTTRRTAGRSQRRCRGGAEEGDRALGLILVGPPGLEPGSAGYEPGALPLSYRPRCDYSTRRARDRSGLPLQPRVHKAFHEAPLEENEHDQERQDDDHGAGGDQVPLRARFRGLGK